MFITKKPELFERILLPFQVTFIFVYPSLVTVLFVSILFKTTCGFLTLHPFCSLHHLTLEHSSFFLSENLPAGIFHESICIELFIVTIKSAFV